MQWQWQLPFAVAACCLLLAFSCEQFQGIAHIKRVDVAVAVAIAVVVFVFVAGTLRLGAQLICAPKRTHVSVRYISESVGRHRCARKYNLIWHTL